MSIKSTGYSFEDFSELTELVPRLPKLLGELGLFGESAYHRSTLIEVERLEDGVDEILAQSRGGDRNFSGGETAIQVPFKIPYFPLDSKHFTAADIQDMRDFVEDPNIPMTMQRRMDRARARLARSHSVLSERARYKALKGTSYAPNDASCQVVYAEKFDVVAKVKAQFEIDLTDANVDPRTTVEAEARKHIQKYAGDQADAYQVIALCGSTAFSGIAKHPKVEKAYSEYPSASEPLRNRLGGNLINRSWETEGVTYIEDFVGQSIGEIAADEIWFLPLGILDMFQTHFAPADVIEYANTEAQEMYMFVEEKPRSAQVQTETSFLTVNTRPELVVNAKVKLA